MFLTLCVLSIFVSFYTKARFCVHQKKVCIWKWRSQLFCVTVSHHFVLKAFILSLLLYWWMQVIKKNIWNPLFLQKKIISACGQYFGQTWNAGLLDIECFRILEENESNSSVFQSYLIFSASLFLDYVLCLAKREYVALCSNYILQYSRAILLGRVHICLHSSLTSVFGAPMSFRTLPSVSNVLIWLHAHGIMAHYTIGEPASRKLLAVV